MQSLLTRKDIRGRFGIVPSTLYRWEREKGLTFRNGRITESEFAFWCEQVEAARTLGMRILDFLGRSRPEREVLLARAHCKRHGLAPIEECYHPELSLD